MSNGVSPNDDGKKSDDTNSNVPATPGRIDIFAAIHALGCSTVQGARRDESGGRTDCPVTSDAHPNWTLNPERIGGQTANVNCSAVAVVVSDDFLRLVSQCVH